MIRLVCIDVDGTLIGKSGLVPPAVWSAAEHLRSRGIRLAICSGRPAFGNAREYAQRLDADGWHVFQNGASIVQLLTGESQSQPLPSEAVQWLIERARQESRVIELYSDAQYAVEVDTPNARKHAALMGVPFVLRRLDSLDAPIVRAQWLTPNADVDHVMAEVAPGADIVHSTSPSFPDIAFIQLTKAGVGKASAVRQIASAYGVDLMETMFVGDGRNDVAAMREVGLPVAMGNAEPEARAVARAQVGHVDDGGLAEALALAL